MMFSTLMIEHLMIISNRKYSIIRKIMHLFFMIKVNNKFKERLKNPSITSNDVKDFIACCKFICNKKLMYANSLDNNRFVVCTIYTVKDDIISNLDSITLTQNTSTHEIKLENDMLEYILHSINDSKIITRKTIDDGELLRLLFDLYKENILTVGEIR